MTKKKLAGTKGTKKHDEAWCLHCHHKVGVIEEVEDPARPGFFANVSTPKTIPTHCPECEHIIVRVAGG